MKEINFKLREFDCQINNQPGIGECCCNCKHSKEVFKHCAHVIEDRTDCICNQPIGFFICTDRFQISSKHGYCEIYEGLDNESIQ